MILASVASILAMAGLGDLGLLLIGGAILGAVYLYIRWRIQERAQLVSKRMQYGYAISDDNCGNC